MKLRSFAFTLLVLVACRSARPKPVETPPPAPPPPPVEQPNTRIQTDPTDTRSGLRFQVDPPDAEVFVDDTSYGVASALQNVPLAPGIYRVAVKAPGHTTWRAEVSVGNQMEILNITLPKRQ